MNKLLIRNGTVITLGQDNRVLHDHGIEIHDSRIKRIAPSDTFDATAFDDIIDAGGRVVMPGFINAHMHFYSSFATGFGKAEPAGNFLEVLNNLWWRLDKTLTIEDCHFSAMVACVQAIKHGTTTIIDHHASPMAVTGSLRRVADAVMDSGLRASLCYEVSDRDGPAIAEAGIEENLAFIETLAKQPNDRLHGLFGMHAAFTIGEATMSTAMDAIRDLDTGVHIHVAEDRADQDFSQENYGIPVVERLFRHGVLGPKTICAHCVHVNDRELDLLQETDTVVTYQAQSNMNNAVGVMDLPAFERRGITVGLGTDAMTLNMTEELRCALWVQKLEQRDPSAAFAEVTRCLLHNNARIANRLWSCGLGEIREGFAADIAIFDYHPHTPMDADNIAGHVVFGLSQAPVDTTIASGRVLMRHGNLICLDETAIAAEARGRAADLWSRF